MRIAIQKEGRLRDYSIEFLASLGLEFPRDNGRTLVASCTNADVEILSVRHSDLPQYVQSGAADFAVVGGNVLREQDSRVREIKKLNFGTCSLVIAVPVASPIQKVQDLEGERIATSYPNSLCKFLQKQKINAAVVAIHGAVEVAPALGLADAICDLTQTGTTLRKNGLELIGTLWDSTAVFIESPFDRIEKDELRAQFLTPFL